MGQVSTNDVNQAFGMLAEEDEVLSGPVLTDRQSQQFAELAQISDTEEKAAKTSEMINELLEQVAEGDRRLKEIFDQAGLDTELMHRFLGGERVAPESKKQIDAEMEQFRNAVVEAVTDEANRLAGSSTMSTAPKLGRVRV